MFYYHQIKTINGENYLYLYLDNYFEFSKEFITQKDKVKKRSLIKHIKNYIKTHNVNFKGKKVHIIVGGLILFTIILGNTYYNYQLNDYRDPNYQYVETMDNLLNTKEEEQLDTKKEEPKVINKEKTEVKEEHQSTIIENKTKVTPKTESPKIIEEPKVIENTPHKIEAVPQETGIKINLIRSSGTVEMDLEDYVIGVVGAEMPASFHIEALKAQAVVARTYALKRVNENKKLTDTNSHQLYKDNNALKAQWGESYNTYYNKIKSAVTATKGEYVAYNGYYIDALYHSTSNGKTEDPINVWGGAFPYLKSVDSHWDKDASTYQKTTTIPVSNFSATLGMEITEETLIEIISKTTGDRVNKMQIGDNIYLGIDIRDLFGLRSADFDISVEGDNIVFTTRGYGHGVGMSQYGANGMAKEGYNYKSILKHYYPNTNILTKD
jgi:stage II sporulation protein D